ncbi:MAG: rhodanese-like domain-containing protein, partial [Vicinamibacterales bacterium]
MSTFHTIDHESARRLLERDGVTVLDVRTPAEFDQLGHVPGAWLLPVDLMASAPAVLPRDHGPVLVYCEHGIRSAAASQLLSAAGIEVFNLAGGLAVWTGPREFGSRPVHGPAAWLIENADLLPRGGQVLD